MSFLIRWVVTAIAVGAAVWIVPGITTVGNDATVAVIVGALILSLINISIKPILQILSLPITVFTLGIFYLIVNALILELAAVVGTGLFGSGIAIDGLGSAILGSIVISIVSAIVNSVLGTDSRRNG
ncbi:MAG: phage holin family protein [Eggerthellaceae bacterium]|nr:phage holin family protein [Eggerthellaceae bacterium]